jgi:putative spermidine/putrescine transport system ATP-binding protein
VAGALSIQSLSKSYAGLRAVDRVSLDAADGEFVTLLGPSGSGKTTTLQMVAGFVQPDQGRVFLDGRELTGVPAYRRNIGMVFQNYALFPHMTVEQNVAFPLDARGIGRAESRQRIARALEMVGLSGLERRTPRQLSGGQQQRVALARAIVFQPPLLLMDEPLGALDKKLRDRLQLEIMELSRGLGVTVIYVTHDQEEALVMSNRIAVFHRGRIEQIGSPSDLYERPASVFVAGFIGESNMFMGDLELDGDAAAVRAGNRVLRVDACAARQALASGKQATVVVRPERLRVHPAASAPLQEPESKTAARLPGRIREAIYLGAVRKYVVDLGDGTRVAARVPTELDGTQLSAGDEVLVSWDLDRGIVLPGGSDGADVSGEPSSVETRSAGGAEVRDDRGPA